jgi:RNA polymerase sigma-70 factor (ECF subfamily)
MAHDDADLIRRWNRGDATAFEALVRRWQGPVARFLARITGRPGGEPDLCQEVFLRVLRSAGRYREEGAFSTWLYQIALNAARDAARRRRHDPQPLDGTDPPGEAPTAERDCERRELAEAVTAALAKLPEPLREVLVLRHYEGMSFEQMARVLGTPATTLKSRFAVALRQMQARLRRLGFCPEGNQS